MQRLFFGVCALFSLIGASTAHAEEKPHPEEQPQAKAAQHASSTELGFLLVPWGMAYIRSLVGLRLQHKVPLVERPGILWESTNVTFGVRDFFVYVNNSLGAFVQVTPIAFFSLGVAASYETLLPSPFNGGMRVLTPTGRQRLSEGIVERGNPNAVDWVDGEENQEIFYGSKFGDGLRLQVQPTLQGKLGPVGAQYKFTADFNFFRADGYNSDDIFKDGPSFSLRKLTDRAFMQELAVAYEVQNIRDELLAGLNGRYYHSPFADLDRATLCAFVFYRPAARWLNDRMSLWFSGEAGTNLVDPMHQYEFSWVTALGVNVELGEVAPSKPE